eukprot:gene5688-6876_t
MYDREQQQAENQKNGNPQRLLPTAPGETSGIKIQITKENGNDRAVDSIPELLGTVVESIEPGDQPDLQRRREKRDTRSGGELAAAETPPGEEFDPIEETGNLIQVWNVQLEGHIVMWGPLDATEEETGDGIKATSCLLKDLFPGVPQPVIMEGAVAPTVVWTGTHARYINLAFAQPEIAVVFQATTYVQFPLPAIPIGVDRWVRRAHPELFVIVLKPETYAWLVTRGKHQIEVNFATEEDCAGGNRQLVAAVTLRISEYSRKGAKRGGWERRGRGAPPSVNLDQIVTKAAEEVVRAAREAATAEQQGITDAVATRLRGVEQSVKDLVTKCEKGLESTRLGTAETTGAVQRSNTLFINFATTWTQQAQQTARAEGAASIAVLEAELMLANAREKAVAAAARAAVETPPEEKFDSIEEVIAFLRNKLGKLDKHRQSIYKTEQGTAT